MDKKVALLFSVLLMLCLLGGCDASRLSGKEKEGSPQGKDGSQEESILLSLEDLKWRDNSLDAYSAAFILPLRYSEGEGELQGGLWKCCIGEEDAVGLKKHMSKNAQESWDEVKVVTDQGEEFSYRLDFWEGVRNQAWAIGSIYGSDHCLMMNCFRSEESKLIYRFFEADKEMQLIKSFYVNGLDEETMEVPGQMLVDAKGSIHLITDHLYSANNLQNADPAKHYYILPAGSEELTEIDIELSEENSPMLFYLYDGRVGLWKGEFSNGSISTMDHLAVRKEVKLMQANLETKKMEMLACLKQESLICTLLDENTILFADGEGVHRQAISGGEKETLYTWNQHGIVFYGIYALEVGEDQAIRLIYGTNEGYCYIKLTPTVEEVPVQEVEFAVDATSGPKLQAAVADFNRKYPTYHIKMKKYGKQDTSLLTKMIAGDGPQLLDAGLIGFEDHEDWWEPLEPTLRQVGLEGELLPQILEMGKIDGTVRGVVTDFMVETMVTFSEESKNWDRKAFLDEFSEDDPTLKCVYLPVSGGGDGFGFISHFFFHDLDETFLYNAEKCEAKFDGAEFQKILRLADHFMKRENQSDSEDLRLGSCPYAVVTLTRPEDLAYLRIWGKNKLHYIGNPSQDGPVHYLESGEPICVRANATAEEKRLALTFLCYLLSYDAQKENALPISNLNYHFSVRKDVLREQMERLNQMNEDSRPYTIGFPQERVADMIGSDKDLKIVDVKADYDMLMGLLEHAKPKRYMPKELRSIMIGEIDGYLSGTISKELLIEQLTNRVELYLKERKDGN